MDSELDRTLNEFDDESRREFEAYLDEWMSEDLDPKEGDNANSDNGSTLSGVV